MEHEHADETAYPDEAAVGAPADERATRPAT
jgi:hypothetical protein